MTINAIEDLPCTLHTSHMSQYLGLSLQTIRSECRLGNIPAKHVGRTWVISKEMFLQWLNNANDEGVRHDILQ